MMTFIATPPLAALALIAASALPAAAACGQIGNGCDNTISPIAGAVECKNENNTPSIIINDSKDAHESSHGCGALYSILTDDPVTKPDGKGGTVPVDCGAKIAIPVCGEG